MVEILLANNSAVSIRAMSHRLTLRQEQRQKNFQEEQRKNSTIKPLSTLSVSCMKNPGEHGPLCPSADAYALQSACSFRKGMNCKYLKKSQ